MNRSPSHTGQAGTRPRLSPAARRRIADAKSQDLWSSCLGTGGDLALRSTGFVPIGVVTASIPSWPFAFRYPPSLAVRRSLGSTYYPGSAPDDPLSARRLGGFSHDYSRGQTGVMPDLGWSWQRVVHELRDRQLFEAVVAQLSAEAAALGAVGVVGVEVEWIPRPALGTAEFPVFELKATGLAVAAGTAGTAVLFTTALDGAGVAMLLRDGWAPACVVLGVGRVRAELGNVTRRRLRSLDLGEVHQFSEALEKALELSLTDLERRGSAEADEVMACRHHIGFEREEGTGLEVSCRVVGSGVVRMGHADPLEFLSVVPLR